jgi:hypothetical protein
VGRQLQADDVIREALYDSAPDWQVCGQPPDQGTSARHRHDLLDGGVDGVEELELLFDHPGARLRMTGRVAHLDAQVDDDPDLELLRALAWGVTHMSHDDHARASLLCPLPPSSYHVTLYGFTDMATFFTRLPTTSDAGTA